MSNHYGMKRIDGQMSLSSLSPTGHTKNTKGPQRSNVLKIFFLVGVMVSTCHGSLYFKIDNQNSSTTSVICSYGDSMEGQHFDVFRNGQHCLAAAFSACASVGNQGCFCEEDMALNEVRFTIELPHDHDKCTLKCNLLGEVPEEKTIIVMPEDGTVMDKCGTLQINNMHFKVSILEENCHIHHQFICRLGEWHNSPVTYISEQSANWSEAKSRCSGMQGDLLYLKPQENLKHLETKLMSFPGKTFFVGLNHKQLAWKWEDGSEILYYNWLQDKPNFSSGNCLMMYSQTAKWKVSDCNTAALAFCQNGTSMEMPIHDSGTGNSNDDKPLEALCNSRVIIYTLGSLLAVSVVIIIMCCTVICLTNAVHGRTQSPTPQANQEEQRPTLQTNQEEIPRTAENGDNLGETTC